VRRDLRDHVVGAKSYISARLRRELWHRAGHDLARGRCWVDRKLMSVAGHHQGLACGGLASSRGLWLHFMAVNVWPARRPWGKICCAEFLSHCPDQPMSEITGAHARMSTSCRNRRATCGRPKLDPAGTADSLARRRSVLRQVAVRSAGCSSGLDLSRGRGAAGPSRLAHRRSPACRTAL